MFTTEELKMLCMAVDAAWERHCHEPQYQQLYDKTHTIYRHQEMHEIMQEFLGVSKSYMIRLRDYDEVDVSGVPEVVYEGPNYQRPWNPWMPDNRPEDRSGVQDERFRRVMPQPLGWMIERKKTFDEWQENCPDYDEGCITCVAWRLFLETGRCPTYDEANAALPADYR